MIDLMTDLELTRLCAEAMGLKISKVYDGGTIVLSSSHCFNHIYNPLHNDAQAMALVKKFGLRTGKNSVGQWTAEQPGNELLEGVLGVADPSLNRAIVECAAKLSQAK